VDILEKFEKIAFEDLENVAGGQITPDEAIAAALKHANLNKDDVIMKKAKIDHEDGGLVYEVEFFRSTLPVLLCFIRGCVCVSWSCLCIA